MTKLLKLDHGFLWKIKGFILYWATLLFELVYKFVKNPLISAIIIMILLKLLTVYGSYRSFLFNIEFGKISQLAKKPNSQEAMAKALQRLNFPEQALYMVLRIGIVLTIYAVIQNSPYFFKSSFLWISDLSKPDSLGITNLFGLIKQPSYLPVIGLTPLLAVTGIAYEVLQNKQQDKQSQYIMYSVIGIAVFTLSTIQSALCIFIFVSSVVDQLQNYAFRKIRGKR